MRNAVIQEAIQNPRHCFQADQLAESISLLAKILGEVEAGNVQT